ncbi:MAG: hypothetical protein KGI71_04635 [Patescibacteria group bacterium]|nr:hypothetical protein [Patescibacteria group bacterium]
MPTMKILVPVNVTETIRAGIAISADPAPVEIDLETLSLDERVMLAHSLRANRLPWSIVPTPAAVQAALQRQVLLQAQREREEEETRRQQHETYVRDALQVLQDRRTVDVWDTVRAGESRAKVCTQRPAWPRRSWEYADDPANTPEAVAWIAELRATAQATMAAARQDVAERERKRLEQIARAAARQAAWIRSHGSDRLRRLLDEGIEHQAIYRDERLAAERPGWQYADQLRGKADVPRNPPAEALTLLDEARVHDKQAQLVYWRIETEDYDDESGEDRYEYLGYAAVATFLDRQIVFGVPDQYHVAS